MLITNHVLAGALVGRLSSGPARAFVTGVVSHAAMDMLPHWGDDRHHVFMRMAVVDGLVGLGALTWVTVRTPADRRTTVVAGMLGACFPDADKPGRELAGRSPFPAVVDRWHARIQRESPDRLVQEVLVAATGLLAVRRWVLGARLSGGASRSRGPGRARRRQLSGRVRAGGAAPAARPGR